METGAPRVDVVIPCYNYARYLQQCVASVLGQEGVQVRALVIDDCSTDDTPLVGRLLAARDPRVVFRRHERNRGHIATYNEGLLEWADGDHVLLLSADDMLAPGALARAVDAFRRHPEAGLCYGAALDFEDQPPTPPDADTGADRRLDLLDGRALITMACDAGDNPVSTPTAVLRMDLQRRIGGYRADMPHTADLAMWLCCAALGPVVRLHAVQAYKREHPANMQKLYAPRILPDLEQRLLAFEVSITRYADHIADADRLLAKARGTLAGQAFWGAHRLFEGGQPQLVAALLDFCLELDPGWRDRPEWRRLAWKRRMGTAVWNTLGPLLQRLRGAARTGRASEAGRR